MKLKNLATIIVLSTGSFMNSSPVLANNLRQEKTLGDVLKYVESNPYHRELIIGYALDFNKEKASFSQDTIDRMAGVVLEEIRENPEKMKDYVLNVSAEGLRSSYRQEVWQQLTLDEKWDLFAEMSHYKTKECWEETREVAKDAYERFSETKLYDKIKFTRDRTVEMVKDRARFLGRTIPGVRRFIKPYGSGEEDEH